MSDNKEVSGAVKEIAIETVDKCIACLWFGDQKHADKREGYDPLTPRERMVVYVQDAITRALSGQEALPAQGQCEKCDGHGVIRDEYGVYRCPDCRVKE